MIKNLIFDMGQVLVNNDYKVLLKNAVPEDEYDKYNKIVYQSQPWLMLDNGTISTQDAIKEMQKGQDDKTKQKIVYIMQHSKFWRIINEKLVNCIKNYKKNGYKLYILSNTSFDFINYLKSFDSYLSLFDGFVFSCEEHTMKPEAKIYNILLQRYNLTPQECIFVDDKKENIDAGINLGINGIIYDINNNQGFVKQLAKYNVIQKEK